MVLVRRLAWDSQHFGVEVGRVEVDGPAELPNATVRCRELRLRVAYLDVTVDDGAVFEAALATGFRLTETKMELRSEQPSGPWEVPDTIDAIRPPLESELGAVEALAGSVVFPTRFFFDTGFPRAAAHQLYVEWVRRAHARPGDDVLAAFADGRVVGFTAMSVGDGSLGVHELAAVDPVLTVRGLGRALYGTTVDVLRARGCSMISGTTQLQNLPAMRTLEALGYRIAGARHTLHRWFD